MPARFRYSAVQGGEVGGKTMAYRLRFDYFHGDESNMLSFVRIPKIMFTDSHFAKLTNDAKVLYSLFVDRISLSVKNGWIDKDKRVYIYFSVEDAARELNVGESKARKTIKELDSETGIGLIERKNQGFGKPAIIYVKNFFVDRDEESEGVDNVDKSGSDRYISTVKTDEFYRSGPVNFTGQDRYISLPNNTEYNNTEMNKSNPISSASQNDGMGKDANVQNDYELCESLVKKNIEYDYLVTSDQYKYDKETIDGIVDLMTGIMTTKRQYIVICGDTKPRDVVKSQLMKLNQFHIEYVVDCLKKNDTKVKNMKQYMLAALYNAPITMDSYYDNWVNSDRRTLAEQKASGF